MLLNSKSKSLEGKSRWDNNSMKKKVMKEMRNPKNTKMKIINPSYSAL